MSIFPDWLMRIVQPPPQPQNYAADVIIQLDVTPEVYEFDVNTVAEDFEVEIIQELLEI